ncbi:outer membrane transport energization protein TonB [Thiogranum longum]|uniref:Outer membrane transport energization protein TonB n=1 Tax=Thiogranum longum TaxID=1537524 RepID=A0A4R1H5P6_9GAMM|nr:AgmX/PglI C-terminal domain-containing protein [Thiogranum longum]TCK17047.1 outer membrane transport energization protein TonB [Thiogranum longum]
MVYSHSLSLPWSISAEDERRFRKALTITLVLTVVLAIAIPYLPVFKKPVEDEVELPPRVAKLVFEKHIEPKPKPKPKPEVVRKKPDPVKKKVKAKKRPPTKVVKKQPPKKPKVDALEQARKKASSAGLLALQDSLSDLRDQSVDELRGARRVSSTATTARKTERSLITSKVGSASKGINTSRLSRDTGSTKLASRTATEVKSSIAKTSLNKKQRNSRTASRSYEDIQIVFDRNKGAIYSLYNRALRKDPSLQGKMVISLTIAPSGKITGIKLVSSELGDAKLEQKLLRRIKMFNFGAKQVGDVTVTYPIDFLPA